jgi:hypothetical protein
MNLPSTQPEVKGNTEQEHMCGRKESYAHEKEMAMGVYIY